MHEPCSKSMLSEETIGGWITSNITQSLMSTMSAKSFGPGIRKLRARKLKSLEDCKAVNHKVNAVKPIVMFLKEGRKRRNSTHKRWEERHTFTSLKRVLVAEYSGFGSKFVVQKGCHWHPK